jgi:uncharacterized protein DUF6516
MQAKLIYRNKIVTEEYITEYVIWALPRVTTDRPHGLKYRLYHGTRSGKCIVRYDNESGKGDHKHILDREVHYHFKDVEQLMDDFKDDIEKFSGGGE